MIEFSRAIVRPPGATYVQGLTTGAYGKPSLELALEQHARYCDALRACGVEIVALPADDERPDATFVEDTAVIVGKRAIATRPGAPERLGEVAAVRDALAPLVEETSDIEEPATLDGGDVCASEEKVFIGISQRTNAAGAEQLTKWLARGGLLATTIDITDIPDLLHLKSGMSYLGGGRFAVADALRTRIEAPTVITVEPEEAYAANCVRVNDTVLIAKGYPSFEMTLNSLGFKTLAVDVSEFRKMDGGLSCLSLRF